ncbi:hypothetical protein PPERSA_08673 [Pseudocohnilembus persalinus]|uniref:Uncharacterized protein n=1 Tax=Pseudocohnilembus persalinus TaxID=266149 RepID=A0A0V0R863_PSEPJ|nr:hypothetical protein PPERSA_08673 [Pseudocohnilembus persalinus]|eukprot:KRX10678.1 hypothetical protein PPERSA_08673 [Pseudocohnilembus persalinus]
MSDPESWKLFKDYNLHTPSDIKEDINNFVREQQFNSKHFYQLQIYRAMLNFDYDSKTLISFRKNQKIITNLKSIEEKMKQQELSRSYIMGILYNALGFLLQHQINHIFNQDQNIDLNKFEDKFVSYIDLKKSVEQAQLVKLAEDYQIELEYFLKTAIAIFQKSIGVNNIYQFSTHKLLINSLLKFEKFTECFKLCTLYMIELEKNPHLIQEDDFQQSAKLYISIYHQKRMQKNKNKLFQQKVQNPNVQQFKQIQQQRDSIFDHAQNDEDHVQQIQQLMHISLGLEDENEELQAKINHKKSFLIEYQKVPINKVREDDLKQSLNQNKTPKFAQKPNHQLKFNNELIQTRKNSLELVIDILKPILNKEENQFQINLTPSPKQNNQENYQQQIESDNNNNNNINNNNNNNNNNNQFLFPSKKNVNLQSEDSVSVSGVSENSSFLQQENSDYQSINSFSQNDISYQNSQEQDQIDDNTSLSDLGLHKQKMRNLYKSKSMSSISDDQEIKKYTQIFANKFDNILFNSAEENPKIIQQQQDNQTIKKSPNTYYIETQIKVYQEEINRPEIQIEEIEEMKQEYKQFVQQVSQSPTFYLYKQPILYLQTLIDQKYIMHLEDEKALLQSNYSNKQKSQLLPPLHEKAKSSQNIENSYYTSSSSKSLFGRQTQISRISQKIGRTFYENKNYQKAQQHYQSALQEAKEEKDKIQQIRIQYQQQQNLEMQRIQQIMKYQVQRKKVESSFY